MANIAMTANTAMETSTAETVIATKDTVWLSQLSVDYGVSTRVQIMLFDSKIAAKKGDKVQAYMVDLRRAYGDHKKPRIEINKSNAVVANLIL